MALLRSTAAPLLGLVAVFLLFAASRDLDAFARGDHLGPGFWPRLVLVGLALTCLARLVMEWRAHRAHRRTAGGPTQPVATPTAGLARGRLVVAVGLIVLYVLATPPLGFALATALFIAAFMRLAGACSPVVLGASASVGTVTLLYVFIKLVYLPLPKGAGPFETATLALYRALGIF